MCQKSYGGEKSDNMTEQEAAAIIKSISYEYKKKNKIFGEEALKMAIKALEKQIPKKPNLWGDGYADGVLVYDMYECPNCGRNYELDYDDYDYCPKCGQKFDWSD